MAKFKFEGFSTFPKALYPTGFGFKVSGGQLLAPLYRKYGTKLRLVLSADAPSSIRKTKTTTTVTVNARELAKVNREVSDVKRAKRKEIESLVREFLLDQYPKEFTGTSTGTFKYRPNKIAELLDDQDVVDNLSANDKVAIQTIYPALLDDMVFTLKAPSKVKVVADGIKRSKKVYLKKIIDEFETKLAGNSSEATWQKFLNEHILTLLTLTHMLSNTRAWNWTESFLTSCCSHKAISRNH